jgi:hypothetical protein
MDTISWRHDTNNKRLMKNPEFMGDAPGEKVKVIKGTRYAKGDKVYLRLGQKRSDASDLLLDGMVATIEMIYVDYDGRYHIAVTMDDDPGQEMLRDLGIYRYFSPDELEHVVKP